MLPSKRTILLDSSLTDFNDWVPWFRNRPCSAPVPPIAPLAQLLEPTRSQLIGSLSHLSKRDFLYAKIGSEDAVAFPDLLPGSIVRVNPEVEDNLVLRENSPISDRIFLIEHGKVTCGIRNFRFNESLLHMLQNVEVMGDPVRSCGEESFDMVAPPMKVREFNFTETTKF